MAAPTQIRLLVSGQLSYEAISTLTSLAVRFGGEVLLNPPVSGAEITPSQRKVLAHLRQSTTPLSSIEIAAQTGLARGSVRPWLTALVRAGLVERVPGDKFRAV